MKLLSLRSDLVVDGSIYGESTVGGDDITESISLMYDKMARDDINCIIILGSIISKPTKEAEANEGSGTWSGGYRYYYDMDESDKSKLRLFGKYKQADGDAFKIGYDRQVGKDLNQFEINPDDDGVVFFEQEFKF